MLIDCWSIGTLTRKHGKNTYYTLHILIVIVVNMAPSADIAASTHASGDPDLAFVHDETTAPPSFRDKYAERAYLKHRLAIAFRIFAQFGFAEGVAGHITLRDPVDPTSFWVNPFGMHFSLIKDEDLIRVDHAGNVVDGGKNRRLNYGQ